MKFGEQDYFDIVCISYMAKKTRKYDLKLAYLSCNNNLFISRPQDTTFILTGLLLLGPEKQINLL